MTNTTSTHKNKNKTPYPTVLQSNTQPPPTHKHTSICTLQIAYVTSPRNEKNTEVKPHILYQEGNHPILSSEIYKHTSAAQKSLEQPETLSNVLPYPRTNMPVTFQARSTQREKNRKHLAQPSHFQHRSPLHEPKQHPVVLTRHFGPP